MSDDVAPTNEKIEKRENESLQKSLQEIATLLLLLHENYLKESIGKEEILRSLSRFLDEVGLSESVSLLDVELCRQTVMKDAGNSRESLASCKMGYEMFYEWLREIAGIVFRNGDDGGRRGLHSLLTNYIIPFASSGGSGSSNSNSMGNLHRSTLLSSLPDGSQSDIDVLDILTNYINFLQLWFATLVALPDGKSRLTPIPLFWRKVQSNGSCEITLEQLLKNFNLCGICNQLVTESHLRKLALHVIDSRRKSNTNTSTSHSSNVNISFPCFVSIILSLSRDLMSSPDQSVPPISGSNEDTARQSGINAQMRPILSILHCVADKMLKSTIKKFHEHSRATLQSIDSKDGSHFLLAESLLWLLRQGGLTQMQIASAATNPLATSKQISPITRIVLLFREIKKYSEVSMDGEPIWLLSNIPSTLCSVCATMSGLTLSTFSSTVISREKQTTLYEGIHDLSPLYIAHIAPALLFAHPLQVPSLLEGIYKVPTMQRLETLSLQLYQIFHDCLDLNQTSAPSPTHMTQSSVTPMVMISSIVRLGERVGITPKLVRPSLILKTCAFVLGHDLTGNEFHACICENDMVEALFVIAQVCFGDESLAQSGLSSAPSSPLPQRGGKGEAIRGVDDPFERFELLIKCLTEPDYLQSAMSDDQTPVHPHSHLQPSSILDPSSISSVKQMKENSKDLTTAMSLTTPSSSPMRVNTNAAIARTNAPSQPSVQQAEKGMDGKTGRKPAESGSSLRDVLLLLMHFPLNTARLNPWELVQIFRVISQAAEMESYEGDTTIMLPQIFRAYCEQFGVTPERLAEYFSSLYSRDEQDMPGQNAGEVDQDNRSGGVKMRMEVRNALKHPAYDFLLMDRSLRLLYANAELLRWEYSRWSARLRSADPFTISTLSPIPTTETMRSFPSHTTLTPEAAISFAMQMAHLTKEEAEKELDGSLVLAHSLTYSPQHPFLHSHTHLTFSSFVVFAVKCFTRHFFLKNVPGHHHQPSSQQEAFVSHIRGMLQSFSDNLTHIQKVMRIRILRLLVGNEKDSSRVVLDPAEHLAILQANLTAFSSREVGTLPPSLSQPGSSHLSLELPPRPPGLLWDAPRFLEWAKFSGCLHSVGSLLSAWHAFGEYLTSISAAGSTAWGAVGVVPPVPIKPESHVLHALLAFTLSHSWTHFRQCTPDDGQSSAAALDDIHSVLHFFVSHVLAPTTVTYVDQGIWKQQNQRGVASFPSFSAPLPSAATPATTLEDIIRYGGAAALASFEKEREWIHQLFYSLIPPRTPTTITSDVSSNDAITSSTAPLSSVCKSLSSTGLLRSATVGVCAKQSLHPRLRPHLNTHSSANSSANSSVQGNSLNKETQHGLTIVEFEETFLRCALQAWEAALQLTPAPSNVNRTSQSMLNKYPCPTVDGLLSSIPTGSSNLSTASGSGQFSHAPSIVDAVKAYCNECNTKVRSLREKSSTGKSNLWGVDYVKPFVAAMKSRFSQLPPLIQRDSVGINKTSIPDMVGSDKNHRESVAVVGSTRVETADSNQAMTVKEDRSLLRENQSSDMRPHSSSSSSSSSTSSSSSDRFVKSSAPLPNAVSVEKVKIVPPVPPAPDNIKVLLEKQDVLERSTELLGNILFSRLNHSISDPVSRDLQKHSAPSHISSTSLPAPTSSSATSSSSSSSSLSSSSSSSSSSASSFPGRDVASSITPSSSSSDMTSLRNSSGSGSPLSSPKRSERHSPPRFNSPQNITFRERNSKYSDSDILQSILNEDEEYYLIDGDGDKTNRKDRSKDSRNKDNAPFSLLSNPSLLAVDSDRLLEGTKEALWPVYATYCSCGDSTDPGKLSGPNLFTLLSKLGVLDDRTVLSDVGILLHQISAHTQALSPLAIAGMAPEDVFESPSLSFEEFLVFLCAFSQLRFDGYISVPIMMPTASQTNTNSREGRKLEKNWFDRWQKFMSTSSTFRRLLEECVLPTLQRVPLLAVPEDARTRDRYATVFSLEVLLAVEGAEGPMLSVFEREKRQEATWGHEGACGPLLAALRRINLVPQMISEPQVMQLVDDVIPKLGSKSPRSSITGSFFGSGGGVGVGVVEQLQQRKIMLFPQWEWVLCVVAYQAVEIAVTESSTYTSPDKIPSLIADVITSIASAMQ